MIHIRPCFARFAARTVAVRAIALLLFAGFLPWHAGSRTALQAWNQRSWTAVAHESCPLGGLLLRDYPDFLDSDARAAISGAFRQYSEASQKTWFVHSRRTSITEEALREGLAQADAQFQSAASGMAAGFARIPNLIDLSGQAPSTVAYTLSFPFPSAVLVVRRQQAPDDLPRFVWKKVDLGSRSPIARSLAKPSRRLCNC